MRTRRLRVTAVSDTACVKVCVRVCVSVNRSAHAYEKMEKNVVAWLLQNREKGLSI